MIAPAARMMSPGPYYRQTLRKLRFLKTGNSIQFSAATLGR
jgi:hypothetical protein